jgi:hypothetical protein
MFAKFCSEFYESIVIGFLGLMIFGFVGSAHLPVLPVGAAVTTATPAHSEAYTDGTGSSSPSASAPTTRTPPSPPPPPTAPTTRAPATAYARTTSTTPWP